jgi:gamma-glutamyltranspeptidase/glutathione hydrolase
MYEAIGYRHAAATAHPLATRAAARMLRMGGSAVDAAIAANAMLAVTQPDACGPGGDLFALVYSAAEGKVHAYAAAGPAGANADRESLRSRFERIPPRSAMAVTLPGAVRGWELLHRRHGSLPWQELFAPAADVAELGHPVTRKVSGSLKAAESFVDDAFRAAWLPSGVPRPGELLRNPDLAATLRTIATEGADWFYLGPFAKAFERVLEAGGGFVTAKDMGSFAAEEVTPLEARYRGRTVTVTPPPSQGVALLLGLRVLEGFSPSGESFENPRWLHLTVEAKRRAFLLRDSLLTDPKAVPRDWRRLLEDAPIALARADIDESRSRRPSQDLLPGDTTFLCTIDGDGNACALVQSLYMGVGSGILVPGSGVHLQNRGCYFSLEAGHPNALSPGKRTAHTLMASIVTDEGGLRAALGTMGGDGQPQTLLQVLSRLYDYGQDVDDAIAAPRWLDGGEAEPVLQLEEGLGTFAADLEARGHTVRLIGPRMHAMGHAQGIVRREDGLLRATADPRGDGIGWAE